MKRRKKYLNNKDILKEIHLSKNSFCSFLDKTNNNQFDIILQDLSEINDETIEIAKTNKAKRLSDETDQPVEISSVATQDLVFRIMTEEHIPLVIKKKSKAKPRSNNTSKILNELVNNETSTSDETNQKTQEELIAWAKENDIELIHMKVNFPSFFHYRLNSDQQPYIVGKSHWIGDLETGHFSQTHGQITHNLALMYLKLCDRYATRGNWHGYTYVDEMKGQAILQLTQVGLQFNEAITQNPFMYFSRVCKRAFLGILLYEKKMQNMRDDILENYGLNPSWTRQFENENVDGKYLDENGFLKD